MAASIASSTPLKPSLSNSTTASVAAPPPLPQHTTLSPSTLATLAPHAFLNAHLTSSSPLTRPNGRQPSHLRPLALNLGSLTHANGSSLIRLGDTAVVCGVRAEILDVRDIANYRVTQQTTTKSSTSSSVTATSNAADDDSEIWTHSLLVPNLELRTGASPSPTHLPGAPPSSLAQALSYRLLTLLRSTRLVPTAPLRIYSSPQSEQDSPVLKAYWTLYIDLVLLSSAGGSVFCASWMALLAALHDTVLPAARWDADLESVVCDPDIESATRLGPSLRGQPVPLGFVVFQAPAPKGNATAGKDRWLLLDPDEFEETVCGAEAEESIIVVDRKTSWRGGEGVGWKILRIEAGGENVVVDRKEMEALVQTAGERWEQWKRVWEEAQDLARVAR